jgi:WD40 repeat protein
VHLRNFDRALELPTIESPFDDYSRGVFNADGSCLLLTGSSDNLAVHDTATGTRVSPLMRHFYDPLSLVGTADGTAALSFASDGRACLWDTTTGEVRLQAIRLDTNHDAKTSLAADGSTILLTPTRSPSGSRLPTVWRATTPAPIARRFHPIERSLSSSRLSPDGGLAAFGPGPYSIVYEIATGRTLLDVPTRGHCYIHLFSPDGTRCYALTASGWRYGWSLIDGTELWPPAREPGLIRPGELSPDGTRIAAGHNDGHIRIYDTADGRLVHTLPHPGEIKVIRFAPDGSGRFVSGSTNRLAHVWDVTTGKKIATLKGHTDNLIAAAWSPDARMIATASYDRSARLWDARSGQSIGTPLPHAAWLSHLEISPDGKLLATGCRDGTLRFWHLPDGSPASPPLPQKSTVHTVRFTADGKAVLVVDHQGFRFWDPERAEPLTLHVRDPMTSGVGMDSESWRAFMNADGSRVLTGVAAAGTALHTVAQPREPVPPWFPELLESLAQMRFDNAETPHLLDGTGVFEIRKTLATATGPYAEWARRVIGVDQ